MNKILNRPICHLSNDEALSILDEIKSSYQSSQPYQLLNNNIINNNNIDTQNYLYNNLNSNLNNLNGNINNNYHLPPHPHSHNITQQNNLNLPNFYHSQI